MRDIFKKEKIRMMQTEIAEILNNMREENQRNIENFEKVLSGINTKLEVMSEDDEAVDLVKFYIAELKKAVEDKHSSAMIRFDALEASFDTLVSSQLEVAKTSELKDLFGVFSAHNDAFIAEISSQKALLDDLSSQLSLVAEKAFDKEELASVIQDVSFDLSVLGENIQKTFTQFEENLKNIDVSENISKLSNSLEELKELVASSSHDYSQEFENLERNFENIITESDFTDFREDLADFVQKIIDNSSLLNTDLSINTERIIETVNAIDYSELKDDLSVLRNCMDELKDVSYQSSFDELSRILAEVSDNVNTLRASVGADVQENYGAIKESLDALITNVQMVKDDLISVVTEQKFDPSEILNAISRINQDAATFAGDIKENSDNNYNALKSYIEETSSNINSILDNCSVLNTDAVINREKLSQIAENINKFEPVNYSYDIQQVASKLDNLTGDTSIINKTVEEKFENIKELVASLDNSEAVRHQFESFERAFSKIVTSEDFLHFKSDFAEFIQKIVDNSNALYENSNLAKEHAGENFERLNNALADLAANVQYLRDISAHKPAEILDNINSYIDNAVEKLNSNSELNLGDLKNSFEKVVNEIGEIKEDFVQKNDVNVFNISSGFDNVKMSLENLLSALHSMGAANESVFALDEKINRLNDVISALTTDMLLKQDEVVQHINDTNDTRFAQMKSLNDNLDGLRGYIDQSVECLKNYMSEIEVSANSAKISGDERISQKLMDLESTLIQSTGDYEQKMEILQAKITEFAHIVENSNSDTEGKIASSLDEIEAVKTELMTLNDVLKSAKMSNDEKFGETVSLIDAGIESIIFNITNLSENVINGLNTSINENISGIDEKFNNVFDTLNEVKSQYTLNNVDLIQDIEDKVASLKDELDLINSDITKAFECKTEEIVRAFEPVKTGIDEFLGFDFEKILADLKSQIELSFMNFSVDINNEFVKNSQTAARLEQSFLETLNKLSLIEECVSEKIHNNIELLNLTVENAVRDIKVNLETKIEEQACELKSYIENSNDTTEFEKSIDCLKDSFENSVCEINTKLDIIVSDNSVEELYDRFDELAENDEKVTDMMSNLQSKFDIIAADKSLKDDILNTQEKISELISTLDMKIDTIALDNSIQENISQTEEKVSDMLSALHAKVDALAEDNSEFDILEEIDGIKDIIFEQRKFFEVSSDEKASAIDKYLRDVLLKLDNVDLEKNSEDIKESILTALVSLVDQISFVEETEEIKDFVEEKTQEINQNLLDVKNQLKQLTSPGDDFDYTYTLQDVESDIAKLRLAVTNMSGADLSDVTDEIKRIVEAVEGLETSLTQEQIIDLKSDIEKLNEDIVSISSRTNKLLLNSDEAYKALNDGLNNFSNIIYKLEDRINYLDNTDTSERVERKLDNIHSLAVEADNANKVSRQVMMYLGEWIDKAGESINLISEKTFEIDSIKENIQELRQVIPEKNVILDEIERKFEKQEERIDRLEMGLDKVLSILEQKDDTMLERKVDNIEKLLSALGTNIEKLTSYVDEE